MTNTATMQAAIVGATDGPFTLTDLPRPIARAGEVLVKIHASGINPLDLKIRAGKADHARHPLPAVPGIDMAGVVEAVGGGVTGFSKGDEVFGMTGGVGGLQGSLAQYAAVDALLLARKPAALNMREAASLPLAFITAWEGLVDRGRVRHDMQVLVHGGAGGVGYMAIQIARAAGAQVYSTVSAADFRLMTDRSVLPIDRHAMSVQDYVDIHTGGRGFDLVVDNVGGEILDASFRAIARFGHVVSALGWGTHSLAPLSFRGGSYSGVFTLLPLAYRRGQGTPRRYSSPGRAHGGRRHAAAAGKCCAIQLGHRRAGICAGRFGEQRWQAGGRCVVTDKNVSCPKVFTGSRVRTLLSGKETDGAYCMLEFRGPPGRSTPLHMHERETEAVHLLDGQLDITMGGTTVHLQPGDTLLLPRDVPHQLTTCGNHDARYIVVCTPAGFEDFIERCARPDTGEWPPAGPGADDIQRLKTQAPLFGITLFPPR
jgi:NADPH2:quinone reductase